VIASPLLAKPLDFANAVFIFIVSFLSHYAIDAIPHWDYGLNSFVKIFDENGVYRGKRKFIFQKRLLIKDLIKILFDFIIGLLMIFFLIGFKNIFMILLIIFASSLPDILQVCCAFLKSPKPKILEFERKFHYYIHGKKIFENKPILGIISQILTLIIIIIFFEIF